MRGTTLLGLIATLLTVFLSATWLLQPDEIPFEMRQRPSFETEDLFLVIGELSQAQVQYMPQVDIPAFPELIPWEPPECPQVVEEPGYFEILWGVLRGAFRFIMAPDITGVALNSTINTDGDTTIYNPEPLVRVVSGVHLRVAIYAWDEKTEAMVPVKLADDCGLDIKGGQTAYIKWLYEDDPQLIRVRDLEQKIKKLEASNDALTTDVLRLVGKELRRKDDVDKTWWEANDYWEATHTALCAWVLSVVTRPHSISQGDFHPAWSALRKACEK